MKIMKVTRKTHPATFKKCNSLGELIATIEKEGERDKLYITQIYLNNRSMDNEEEQLLDALSITEVDCLTVHFATINEIVKKTLTDIIYSIQSVQVKSIEFAREFRKNYEVDDEKVKYILIQCRQIINSLEEVFSSHANEALMLKHHSLWHEAEKELTNILQCIFQARKMPGFEIVCDLLEYDLVHALDQWEEVLERELLENNQLKGIFNLNNGSMKSDNGVDA
jgi:hypothetical protein